MLPEVNFIPEYDLSSANKCSDRFDIFTANSEYGVSQTPEAIPRVLCKNCCPHRHGICADTAKVSYCGLSFLCFNNFNSPETILVLRSLSSFESLYLSRTTNRVNEVVAQSFSGGARQPPGLNEGVNIARTVANELDSARFDALLARSVSKGVGVCLEGMVDRADGLVGSFNL
jgi:hypothetical protein